MEKQTENLNAGSGSDELICYIDDYLWETEEPLATNTDTMNDYLEYHLYDNFRILLVDESYAEITDEQGHRFEVHASGDGDFTHHKVEFVAI